MRARWMVTSVSAIAVAVAACSGPAKTTPPPASGSPPVTTTGDASDGGDTTPAPDDRLSEEECLALLEHTLSIAIEDKRRTAPDQVPTEPEIAKIRASLHDEVPECQAQMTRETFQCAMGATTVDAFRDCAQ